MIIAIVGPTGVGKTKLSIMLAKTLKNAEIINCDSMQVYKEMNIGVAKIKNFEKQGIVHHLLDVVSVEDEFSVYDYQRIGRSIIEKLKGENKNIIIVGGTGFYLKALLYDYNFNNDGKNDTKLYDFKIIGLSRDREVLYDAINRRVDEMFDEGLLDEVKALYDKKLNSRVLKTAIGYKELYDYFDGKSSLNEAKDAIKQASRRYAKRQYTFFKHQFDNISWYNIDKYSFEEIISFVCGH